MQVQGFNHITLNVFNLESTLEFYTNVLGMKIRHKGNSDAYLEWGSAWICIIEKPNYNSLDKANVGVDHVAFYIDAAEFDKAIQILQANQVKIVRGPITRGIGMSVNFLDPNGIEFELHTSTLDERMTIWK